MGILEAVRRVRHQTEVLNGWARGYWLVRPSGDRFFISEFVCEKALEKTCKRFLSDTDYQYWIDYCFGLDIDGRVAWSSIDQTDLFI